MLCAKSRREGPRCPGSAKAALEKLWVRSWFWLCQVLLEMGKPALPPWLGGCWQNASGIPGEC